MAQELANRVESLRIGADHFRDTAAMISSSIPIHWETGPKRFAYTTGEVLRPLPTRDRPYVLPGAEVMVFGSQPALEGFSEGDVYLEFSRPVGRTREKRLIAAEPTVISLTDGVLAISRAVRPPQLVTPETTVVDLQALNGSARYPVTTFIDRTGRVSAEDLRVHQNGNDGGMLPPFLKDYDPTVQMAIVNKASSDLLTATYLLGRVSASGPGIRRRLVSQPGTQMRKTAKTYI
jgi:hypothetical protein